MSVTHKYLLIFKIKTTQVESEIISYPNRKLKYKLQIYSSIFIPLSVKVVIEFDKDVYCGLPNWKRENFLNDNAS